MSFAQTLMHYKLGHHPMGGKFFRNHINFHHTYYSKDHLVSRTYLGDEGNNTPFFFIPVFLVGACTYLVLPVDLFVVQVVEQSMADMQRKFGAKKSELRAARLRQLNDHTKFAKGNLEQSSELSYRTPSARVPPCRRVSTPRSLHPATGGVCSAALRGEKARAFRSAI
jgi:hypothetical protein